MFSHFCTNFAVIIIWMLMIILIMRNENLVKPVLSKGVDACWSDKKVCSA